MVAIFKRQANIGGLPSGMADSNRFLVELAELFVLLISLSGFMEVRAIEINISLLNCLIPRSTKKTNMRNDLNEGGSYDVNINSCRSGT